MFTPQILFEVNVGLQNEKYDPYFCVGSFCFHVIYQRGYETMLHILEDNFFVKYLFDNTFYIIIHNTLMMSFHLQLKLENNEAFQIL